MLFCFLQRCIFEAPSSLDPTIMEQIVGTPDAIITTIPMLTTEIENGACHCSVESRGSRFYHNPSLHRSITVGGSSKASDNITRINIALGERRPLFSPESDKVCQQFFFSMIVDARWCSLGIFSMPVQFCLVISDQMKALCPDVYWCSMLTPT